MNFVHSLNPVQKTVVWLFARVDQPLIFCCMNKLNKINTIIKSNTAGLVQLTQIAPLILSRSCLCLVLGSVIRTVLVLLSLTPHPLGRPLSVRAEVHIFKQSFPPLCHSPHSRSVVSSCSASPEVLLGGARSARRPAGRHVLARGGAITCDGEKDTASNALLMADK